MVTEKRALSIEELEAQTALELPDRELMLVTVVITNVLNNLSVDVQVRTTTSRCRSALLFRPLTPLSPPHR